MWEAYFWFDMRRKHLALVAVALVIVIAVAASVVAVTLTQPQNITQRYTYSIVATYPHDSGAFTEGLLYYNGSLYESTGGWGSSTLRRVDLQSGQVQQQISLPEAFYGEGIAEVDGTLVQLTWLERVGFVYDAGTFRQLENFTYLNEGWGLTYDGVKLIMSDGSSILHFLDPVTHQHIGAVNVTDGGSPVESINELEYVNGDVYANIWKEQKIAIINPGSGQVKGWIDLGGIYPQSGDSVLNGIAYDQQGGRLFVTGKDWPSLYEIKIVAAS